MAMNVGELEASIGLDDREFNTRLERAGRRWEGFIGGLAGGAAIKAFDAVGDALGRIAGLAQNAGAAMVSQNAYLESAGTQFEVLLGSASAAQSRIEELYEFAKTTPFEMTDAVEASRVLQVLTQGALATGEGLRLVGDVAAGTGAGFDELAMWIGRAYDAIQSGRPWGESAMRLQELGALSGEARSRIDALAKSGADSTVIWAALAEELGRFDGMMERLATDFSGLSATARDELANVFRIMGEPAFDALKAGLSETLGLVGENSEAIDAWARAIGEALGEATTAMIDMAQAVDWEGLAGDIQETAAAVAGLVVAWRDLNELMDRNPSPQAIGGALGTSHREGIIDTMQAVRGLWREIDQKGISDAFADFLNESSRALFGIEQASEAAGDGVAGFGGAVEGSIDAVAAATSQYRAFYDTIQQVEQATSRVSSGASRMSHPLDPFNQGGGIKDDLSADSRREAERAAEAYAERNRTIKSLQNDIRSAERDLSADIADINADLTADLSEMWRDHTERLQDLAGDRVRLEADFARDTAERHERLQDQLAEITERGAERRADIEEQIADRIAGFADSQEERATRLADRLEDLASNFQDTQSDLQGEIDDIMGSIPQSRRDKYPGVDPMRLLNRRNQERVRDLQERMADEQKEYDRQRARLERDAQREEEREAKKQDRILEELRERLAEEEAETAKARQKAEQAAAKEQQEAERRHGEQLQALQERIRKEETEYARQVQAAQTRAAQDIQRAQRDHAQKLQDLQVRLAREVYENDKAQYTVQKALTATATHQQKINTFMVQDTDRAYSEMDRRAAAHFTYLGQLMDWYRKLLGQASISAATEQYSDAYGSQSVDPPEVVKRNTKDSGEESLTTSGSNITISGPFIQTANITNEADEDRLVAKMENVIVTKLVGAQQAVSDMSVRTLRGRAS